MGLEIKENRIETNRRRQYLGELSGIGRYTEVSETIQFDYRRFREDEFWREIPAYRNVTKKQFLDHKWQLVNSLTRVHELRNILGNLVSSDFYRDVESGFQRAPMSLRLTPYILSLINWADPYDDPLRRQFLTVGSSLLPDHPKLTLDSLHEQADAKAAGLTHRYGDRALFLALDNCPVYCRFCTRSYAVGNNTDQVKKITFRAKSERWDEVFQYVSSRSELEDIIVSGGDSYLLKPRQIRLIGETFLQMENIRRIRFATKGPAVLPQKILTDNEWLGAITHVAGIGRKLYKDVAIHTHFNSANEITQITKTAMDKLFDFGVPVRNQTVLQRGVNDSVGAMQSLVKRLSYCNVRPYYVYVHDLVKGVEDLRTSLQTAIDIDKHVRGCTAGFNVPVFVCDTPGGGGKRDIHSFEHYDRQSGISIYTAPTVKKGYFVYYDPLNTLPLDSQERWKDPAEQERMIRDAVEAAQRAAQEANRSSSVPFTAF